MNDVSMFVAPEWRSLVDIHRLSQWMDETHLAPGKIENVRQLTGGTQNILICFARGDRNYVLRRPPLHAVVNGSQTMRREARLLAALAATDVPHPRLIAACDDETVLGAAFYLMEAVQGFNPSVGLPALHAGDPAIRRQMGFALVEGLAKLGAVDHLAVKLSDFGKIDGFLERQVNRWQRQLENYTGFAGWPGPATLCGLDRIARWLEANRPRTFQPGIMHGDFHLANAMYRQDGPTLAAIIDWEMATIGDPLIDLGWMLSMWPDQDDVSATPQVRPWNGFPSAAEVIAHYAARSRRDLSGIDWYRVFACYKLGIVLEGTYARACAGKAPRATGEAFHQHAIRLIAQARGLIRKCCGE